MNALEEAYRVKTTNVYLAILLNYELKSTETVSAIKDIMMSIKLQTTLFVNYAIIHVILVNKRTVSIVYLAIKI